MYTIINVKNVKYLTQDLIKMLPASEEHLVLIREVSDSYTSPNELFSVPREKPRGRDTES